MTGVIPASLAHRRIELEGQPWAVPAVAPATAKELAGLLAGASERGITIDVWGGGTRHGYGSPQIPDLVVSTSALAGVIEYEPDDLTLLVGAGTSLSAIEDVLAERRQTAGLAESPPSSTVGGAAASAASSLRRLRLGALRERVLQVTLVTGDGRVVTAGGRVVKNVSGYDLARLVVGSFGALGVIVSIRLKLWPVPPAAATVAVDEIGRAASIYRPLALLETADDRLVYVWGTDSEVDAATKDLRGVSHPGLIWPAEPEGRWRWSLRVSPKHTVEAVRRLPEKWRFLALHGVGDVRAASDDAGEAPALRSWAESTGGRLVVVDSPSDSYLDPWGLPPPGIDLQRRMIAQFDPKRVLNRGRLPGGL